MKNKKTIFKFRLLLFKVGWKRFRCKINENLKCCLWQQRTQKRTKIGDSILLSLFICSYVVCEAAWAPPPPPSPGLSGIWFSKYYTGQTKKRNLLYINERSSICNTIKPQFRKIHKYAREVFYYDNVPKFLVVRGMFEMNCLFLSGDFKFQVSLKVLISCPRSTPRG